MNNRVQSLDEIIDYYEDLYNEEESDKNYISSILEKIGTVRSLIIMKEGK